MRDYFSHLGHGLNILRVTVDSPDELSLEESDESLLPEFVKTAHANGVKAGLSIGGWTGSRFFSTNFGSSDNRTAFVKTVTNLADKYNLDALDFECAHF